MEKEKLEKLIAKCIEGERKAQKTLYDLYSPMLYRICLRYMKTVEEAEDALLEGMYIILTKLKHFRGSGSFEGWMKRITINECLMKLRKKQNFRIVLDMSQIELKTVLTVEDHLAYSDLISLLDHLPLGYRTIFNLYVIEGFKHKEIAEMLGISINTSKSQLILAKKRLRTLIKKKHKRHAN